MGLLKRFLEKREFAKHQADANKIASLAIPFLTPTFELTLPVLRRDISSWDLSNRTLLTYLGYVAGVIGNAEASLLGHWNPNEWTARETVFHLAIEGQLDWIPGSESFIKLNRMGNEFGGSSINGLMEYSSFSLGYINGLGDFMKFRAFVESGKPGYYQEGLFKLFLTGESPVQTTG